MRKTVKRPKNQLPTWTKYLNWASSLENCHGPGKTRLLRQSTRKEADLTQEITGLYPSSLWHQKSWKRLFPNKFFNKLSVTYRTSNQAFRRHTGQFHNWPDCAHDVPGSRQWQKRTCRFFMIFQRLLIGYDTGSPCENRASRRGWKGPRLDRRLLTGSAPKSTAGRSTFIMARHSCRRPPGFYSWTALLSDLHPRPSRCWPRWCRMWPVCWWHRSIVHSHEPHHSGCRTAAGVNSTSRWLTEWRWQINASKTSAMELTRSTLPHPKPCIRLRDSNMSWPTDRSISALSPPWHWRGRSTPQASYKKPHESSEYFTGSDVPSRKLHCARYMYVTFVWY